MNDSMKMSFYRMLTVGMFVGWLGVTLSVCAQQNSEPVFGGKNLTFWLQQYYHTILSGGDPSQTALNNEAASAVRAIGTNAIPLLLEMIRWKNSDEVHPSILQFRGIYGFEILGATASNAVPVLVSIFEENKSPAYQESAALALAGIGSGATSAIPAFLRAATNSETSTNTRLLAFGSLAEIPGLYDQVIPIATRAALNTNNIAIEFAAMDVLGNCGSNAIPSIPALVQLSSDENSRLRSSACVTLGKIHSLPDMTVPELITRLGDPEARVRGQAAWGLGNFGILAQKAVPALVELRNDKNPQVRSAAVETLKKINLEKN